MRASQQYQRLRYSNLEAVNCPIFVIPNVIGGLTGLGGSLMHLNLAFRARRTYISIIFFYYEVVKVCTFYFASTHSHTHAAGTYNTQTSTKWIIMALRAQFLFFIFNNEGNVPTQLSRLWQIKCNAHNRTMHNSKDAIKLWIRCMLR